MDAGKPAPALVPFAFDQLVELGPGKPAVALLREREGERYLPIAVGPEEAAALREARAAAEPAGLEETRSVMIAGLAERVFRSQLVTRQGGHYSAAPIRTAEAMAEAIRWSLPIYVGHEVARLGAVYRAADEEARTGSPFSASDDHPIASFPYARGRFDRTVPKIVPVVCGAVFALIVAFVAVIAFIPDGGFGEAASFLTPMLPIVVFGGVLARFTRRFNRSIDETVLEVSPAGIRWRTGDSFKLSVPWCLFSEAGSLWRGLCWRDGLRFVRPIPVRIGRLGKIRMKGFPLEEFEPNWRTGELGRLVRLYAPATLGVTPVDPEGGSIAF